MSVLKKIKSISTLAVVTTLSACSLVMYKPVDTIKQVNPESGYRQKSVIKENAKDGNIVVVMFSGGGTRAAALGYGVLEELQKAKVKGTQKGNTLLDNIDMVFGVSGGSVLATYFALEGKAIIPKFANNFLKSNFQKDILTEVFSLSNLPRLSSPQFGRGDLLQERFNLALYKGKKFGDLVKNRKGPFAVISATDMNIGQQLTFTQETFDGLCLNLNDLEIARAVAASSAVPLIFAPLTLNNNGGNCNFSLPKAFAEQEKTADGLVNIEETEHPLSFYQDSKERPFIHLVDGGLTDNLGLASVLDMSDLLGVEEMYKQVSELRVKNIVVINVNAQNEVSSEIDKTADVPGVKDVVNTIINVPIDSTTQINLQRYSQFSDSWNEYSNKQQAQAKVEMYFVNLGLKELPDGQLKKEVLNIPTSFYLPKEDIDKLRESARILLEQSEVYKKALQALQ